MISSLTPSLLNNEQSTGLGEMGTDLFLELLVAQLQNQNPMEPMDGNALLQQTSQLANVEALQEVSDLQAHIAGLGQFDAAAGMIGQTVTATDPILGAITGVVTGVRATATGPVVQIGSYEVSVEQIVAIATTAATPTAASPVSTSPAAVTPAPVADSATEATEAATAETAEQAAADTRTSVAETGGDVASDTSDAPDDSSEEAAG